MARRASGAGRCAPRAPVTPHIIQGTWAARRFPGCSRFAAHCERLARAFAGARPRERKRPLAEMWATIERRSQLLCDLYPHRDAVVPLLVEVGARAARWIRSPADWEPDVAAPARDQVSSLIRHLFERYPAPRLFASSWWPERGRGRDWDAFGWYLHVAAGGNIRTARGLPTALSRRAAHELTAAPAELSVRSALRWAQLRAVDASPALCAALLRTAVFATFDHDDLWLPLVAKLAAEPAFPLAQVQPLIDYVRHARFDAEHGASFSLKGRSIASLFAAMHRWHAELGRWRLAGAGQSWIQSSWQPMSGTAPLVETRGDVTWSLDEICTARDLAEEGQRMHHCVLSYLAGCASGAVSVWSLRAVDAAGENARVTIRVCVPSRTVKEARSFANGPICAESHRIIRRWAAHHHVAVDPLIVR